MVRKAQINQVFVYILSVIIILFVGFLVIKFIYSFLDSNDERVVANFFTDLKLDYKEVYTNFGSEKSGSYFVTAEVKYLCVTESSNCDFDSLNGISDSQKVQFETIVSSSDSNAVLFGEDFVLSEDSIGEFRTSGVCRCIEAVNNKINLVFENRRNVVWILDE